MHNLHGKNPQLKWSLLPLQWDAASNKGGFIFMFVFLLSLTYHILIKQSCNPLAAKKGRRALFSLTILCSVKDSTVQKFLKVNF